MVPPPRVLVLHDELVARAIKRVLHNALRAEVRWATEVSSALRELDDWTPDILIVDFVVPSAWPAEVSVGCGEYTEEDLLAWQRALSDARRDLPAWESMLSYVPLIAAWRARITPRRAPVIAMESTGGGTPSSLLHDLGVVSALQKPASGEDLIHAVEEAYRLVTRSPSRPTDVRAPAIDR